MPKNLLDLELVKKALAKKQVDTGIYDHYLPSAICEVTGDLYSKGDVSSFPTVEALRDNPEKYVEFLKEILDEYKFSPLDAEIEVYLSGGKKYGTFSTCYLSCENNLGLSFEYDGRLGNMYNFYIDNIYFSQDSSEKALEIARKIEKFFENFRKDRLNNSEEMHIKLLYNDNGRVNWRYLNIPPKDSLENIEDNYSKEFNNFVPEKMDEFIKNDTGGIVIFRGDPGTGKSSYCKHLIMKYSNVADFLIVSQDTILSNPEGFRTFLISGGGIDTVCLEKPKKQIFLIEDCEKLLVERDSITGNSTSIILSDILNYSDGIVGDLVQSKFIFTFNTNLSKVDKALLRKGRMKLNYEFKKLIGEDLDNLLKKLGKTVSEETKRSGMSLADIYNLEEESYIKDKRRIGFQ